MIEIMVVIFLIGVVTAFVSPRISFKEPKSDWNTVLNDLNKLTFFARQEAI